jgi:KaiC/GvpD/RAD55 family RecA-like ATPase
MAKAATGYSGTPLLKKLGIKEGASVAIVGAPDSYAKVLGVKAATELKPELDFIQFFTKSRAELEKQLPKLRKSIKQDGMIWISWPKKSSKVPTDLTENIIRDTALALKLVDVKVCAVDETWSGLKLVIPLKDRSK